MLIAAIEMVEWLADLFGVAPIQMERLLWAALLAGLVFATIHLVTMLVTRWGDGDPTSKSLIFSVLVHLSCAFGVVAVSPPDPEANAPRKRDQRIQIEQLMVEAEEPVSLDRSGNTPVWEKLPDVEEQELTRSERTPQEPPKTETPSRTSREVASLAVDLPDLPHVPDLPAATPQRHEQGDSGPLRRAATPQAPADATAEARPEVRLPSVADRRRPPKRSVRTDAPAERASPRGSTERIAPEFDPDREIAALEAPADASSFLQRGGSDDAIQRRAGPAPSTLPAESTGTDRQQSADTAGGGPAGGTRFSRSRSRPRKEPGDTTLEGRPERSPRTPLPMPERMVAVREGVSNSPSPEDVKPNIVRPRFDAVRSAKTAEVPATYRLRSLENRLDVARKYGGTKESERAVEASLHWLAVHQNPQGFWDADGFSVHCPEGDRCDGKSGRVRIDEDGVNRQQAGLRADTGLTALSVLAFLGAGYTHEEGRYADNVDRALRWLIRQQQSDGNLAGNATRYARMYCHGMATYALAEALGMQTDATSDTRLREPLARAVVYILEQQNPDDGGWRYVKGQRSDMSMFGWQLMALKSAEIAGISVPDRSRNLMIKFLKDRSRGENDGLAAYRLTDPRLPPTPSMTAEALFCKQMLGIKRTNPASVEAVGYLLRNRPRRSEMNLYYWYYGTLAMYQYGGTPWEQWNETLRDTLVAEQSTTGHAAGSWPPQGPWGPYGGRVYSTALSTLCLEVYYRFLPLYRMGR